MNIQIFGAVKIRAYHNISSNPNKPNFVQMDEHYEDDGLMKLLGKKAGSYGRHWTYDGDQGFKESNILVVIGDTHRTFVGRKGLNEALDYLTEMGATKPQ